MIRIFRFAILLHLLLFAIVANAQDLKFSIAEFEQDPLDLTAKEQNRSDGDGYAYAVIKVTSDIEDDDLSKFNFEFGLIKSVKEMHDGQLWLFVARNAKTVSIRREGYKPILNHQFPAIREGMTYTMKLRVQTPKVQHRVLQFKVDPANEGAIVKVKPEGSSANYELWGAVDATGSINNLLETGVYLYEVSAVNYLTSQGRVVLTASANDENYIEKVKLTQNFGYLEINDEHGIAGAEIYINDQKVGTVPYRSNRMECRDDYRLMIRNGELYKTYNATFAITRGETTKLSPRLESNFAETTIKVDGNAEIFINGENKGRGTWRGPLRAGTYNVECRLADHVPSSKQITVKPGIPETFIMDKPAPVEGALYVSTKPSGAHIFIDGKDAGFVTPHRFSNVAVGRHSVNVTLNDYRAETREVKISQGETTRLDVELTEIQKKKSEASPKVTVSSKPEPKRESLPISQYQLKDQFYIQPMAQAGGLTAAGVAVGGFISNVNLEADFLYGIDPETVYWYVDGYDTWYSREKQSPMYIGGKAGYGIVIGSKLRITPQLGGGLMQISKGFSKSYAANATVGVRVDYAVANHVSLVAAPEYGISVTESERYKMISLASTKIKGWASGFNVRLGLSIYF